MGNIVESLYSQANISESNKSFELQAWCCDGNNFNDYREPRYWRRVGNYDTLESAKKDINKARKVSFNHEGDGSVQIVQDGYMIWHDINESSNKKLNENVNNTVFISSNGTHSLNIEDGEYYIDSASFSRIKIDLFSKRENGIKYLYPKLSFSSDGNITVEEASEFSLSLTEAIEFAKKVEDHLANK